MSATQALAETLTRHQIFLERYANGQVREIKPTIERLRKDILNLFLSKALTKDDLIGLEIALVEIGRIIGIEKAAIKRVVDDSVKKVVEYEAGFYARALGRVSTVVASSVATEGILAVVSAKPMQLIQGREVVTTTVEDAVNKFDNSIAKDVVNIIRVGILNAEPQQAIARAITQSMRNRTTRQAETLTRTIINHTTAETRNNINEQVFPNYREKFVATLDSSTTITCASKDGQTFARGEGPMPPLHYGCRSLRVPVIAPEFAVPGFEGERPSIVDGNVEIVSGNTTYSGFLKKQSKEFQDEVLGKERADLFRSGKVPLSKFTDNTGRVLTIDELKAMESLTL